jgi:hypothetical protein
MQVITVDRLTALRDAHLFAKAKFAAIAERYGQAQERYEEMRMAYERALNLFSSASPIDEAEDEYQRSLITKFLG